MEKLVSVLSYITPIGWIMAFYRNKKTPTNEGRFHLRQSLGIYLTSFILKVFTWFIPFIGGSLSYGIGIGMILFLILGAFHAIRGKQKEILLLGGLFQKTLFFIK